MSCPEETKLPLLLYPDELGAGARSALRTHLERCDPCREAWSELARTRDALDALDAPRPHALAGALKRRVLGELEEAFPCPRAAESATGPDPAHLGECPACAATAREAAAVSAALDLLPHPALPPERAEAARARTLAAVGTPPCPFAAELPWANAAERAAHLAACAPCRQTAADFAAVGKALDAVAVPPRSDAERARLKREVLARTAALPARPARVLRLPTLLLRAAALLLCAATLGLVAAALAWRPGAEAAELARLELEADVLVRTGDEAALAAAMQRFARLAAARDARVARRARYEAQGLRALRARRRPPARSVAAGAVAAERSSEERWRARARETLISYRDVLVEFPGSRASLFALKKALPPTERYPWLAGSPLRNFRPRRAPSPSPGSHPYDVTQQRRVEHLLAQRAKVLRWDYSRMRQLGQLAVDPRLLNDPRLRQSVLLQRALQAEALTAVARSDVERERLRAEAVRDLEAVIRLAPQSKAADEARAALRRLG